MGRRRLLDHQGVWGQVTLSISARVAVAVSSWRSALLSRVRAVTAAAWHLP